MAGDGEVEEGITDRQLDKVDVLSEKPVDQMDTT
jgi:hypothetical protein